MTLRLLLACTASVAACLALAGCGGEADHAAGLEAAEILDLMEDQKHDPRGYVEVELGQFRVTHSAAKDEALLLVDFKLFAVLPETKREKLEHALPAYHNRLRDGIRDETLAILKEEGAAVLLVTHEPDEAMRMADEIALMREGRIVQRGAPYTIYNNPVDRAAAEFFSDVNVIHGVVESFATDTPFGRFLTPGLVDRADVEIIIRPQHLKIDFDRNGSGPLPTAARVRVDGLPV